MSTKSSPDKLSLVVSDPHFDKVHYALVMASAAAAIGKQATLFFTMGACQALMDSQQAEVKSWRDMPLSDEPGTGAQRDRFYKENGVGCFEELLEACSAFGVRFMVCEMGLRAKGFERQALRQDIEIEISGVVTFLNDASKDGSIIYI